HLERRERQGRYARWHVPAPVEREPEGWLLTYLDLITLLLVMLVVMLAFSQPKILDGEPDAVAAASLPAGSAAHAQSGNLKASAGTADQTPIASPRAPSSSGNDSSSTLRSPTRAMAEQENDAIDPEARS